MNPLTCGDVAPLIYDHVAGRLSPPEEAAVAAHLAGCEACRKLEAEERVVAELLTTRLPRHAATDALKERLGKLVEDKPTPAVRSRVVTWLAVAALAGAAAAVLGYGILQVNARVDQTVVAEAVNDHLRVLYAEHPIEIESGGIHQVKPWFSGRLDFAPAVAFDGDAEFALVGGAVGYFVDRKAAVFVYKLRLHTVSLFVFRADGLPWGRGTVEVGRERAEVASSRGFHVVMLRSGDLGYAIVSDAGEADLVKLMAKVTGAVKSP